ncbi:uncharacterized protein TNCT_458931 [Trichonephila clavata]|uniref:Transposase n=1 Tax=Trichonephila clavata TaxID=2740835 RepID=A0A8X6J2T6_TRICU|nr:uncharacterized protein TNCT_458931 [Trichonephila clavata]
MLPVYGEKCLSGKAEYNWEKKFSQSRSKIVHEDRSGCSVLIATIPTEQQVEELIRADRRVTIDSIAAAIGCSHGLAYSIMHDHLNCQKVGARWIPRHLIEEHKNESNGHLLSSVWSTKTTSWR